jgi:prepilin-type processing-associated H-X9-DG protein
MRMIALGVISYIQDNKGRLMPCTIPPMAGTNLYPNGFFWATELVTQKYITAPMVGVDASGAIHPPSVSSVFRCPEGIDPTDTSTNGNTSSAQGVYPTDAKNNGWACPFAATNAGVTTGIATWYQLTSRITGFASNYTVGGVFNTPFVYFTANADKLGVPEATDVLDPNYSRRISMIRQPSVTVMIAEAADPNWVTQTPNAAFPGHYAARLGARHGKKSLDGTNAYTNFAFFDGHVAMFPTLPIDSNAGVGALSGQPGCAAMTGASGTIFTLFNQ